MAKDTLIPDLVTIEKSAGEYYFIIADAKYYVAKLEPGKQPKSIPGIESVTKQYFYQQAYKKFIEDYKFTSIVNCFLMPTEESCVIDKGAVSLDMLNALGLQKIKVRFVPAMKAFSCYLSGKKISIKELYL